MGNMGYCRFYNTLESLEDCYDHMGDDDLPDRETKARKKIINLCREIITDFGDED